MEFKPWASWGALSLICALMIGCNHTTRQPDKTLGATSGNPPHGKAITSTGAPAFGPNAKAFPTTTGGLPAGTQFNNAPGVTPAGGQPNFAAPGAGGLTQPNAGTFTPNPKNFIPPNTGSTSFGNPPGLQPTPTPGSPFDNDRITTPTDSPFPGLKMPGQ